MTDKSLPAHLQQVLENHVAHADIAQDKELDEIFARLSELNDTVEALKQRALKNRASKRNAEV